MILTIFIFDIQKIRNNNLIPIFSADPGTVPALLRIQVLHIAVAVIS